MWTTKNLLVIERIDRFARVEDVVAKKLEDAAVHCIRARPGDNGHLAAGSAAVLG
jgi:hypothetical protein